MLIVESGSISAAARILSTTQPTVSRKLNMLEEKCGASLIYRDTHRMQLTNAGHQVLADARSLISLAEESAQRLVENQTQLKGNIRLFSTIDFGQTVVSRLVAAFSRIHHGVTFSLAYSNRPIRMVEDGSDVGIIAGAITDDSVIAKSLGPIRRYPVASPAFLKNASVPSTPQDLASWPWIALSNAQFGHPQKLALHASDGRTETMHITPAIISEGVTSIREIVKAGVGAAILPDWLIIDDLKAEHVVRILPEWHAENLAAHIVYPVQRHMSQRVSSFIDFADSYMRSILERSE